MATEEDIEKFRSAQRNVVLARKAPKMLDALRLIHLIVSPENVARTDGKISLEHIRTLCNGALEGTEDL